MKSPEDQRREYAADRIARRATALSEAITLVQVRQERLEKAIQSGAGAGVPQHEAEAMTAEGLEGLGVPEMIRRAYAGQPVAPDPGARP